MDDVKHNPRLILGTDGVRRVVQILSVPFTIGRGADRDLSLPHPQVSREHAVLDRMGEDYVLRDAGSRHGTFINGSPITTATLHSGDAISLGTSREVLLFEYGESTTRTLLLQMSQSNVSSPRQNDLEKLALFLKAAQSLNRFGAVDDVLRSMLEYTIQLTGAERGFVFLGGDADQFRLECGQDHEGARIAGHPAISYSIVRDAAASEQDFIISDVTDEIAQGRDSLILNAIRSVIAIPLRSHGSPQLLGLLYLDSRAGSRNFTRTGKDILHAIARQAAILLENLRLIASERESALLRKELEIAAAIQRQIIPAILPTFPFAALSARTVSCAGVGGDFYDVIPVPNGFVAIVADVCGKGIPAALLASMVQGKFHGQVDVQTGTKVALADSIKAVNSFVYSRTPLEKYVTIAVLCYIRSDSGDAEVELVNGGHVAPIVVRANGGIEVINDGDLPVGLLDFACFHPIRLTLSKGDRIVLLSDGITEAEDADGVQFGLARLEPHLAVTDPVSSLFSAIEEFCRGTPRQDDQTVLTIERTA